MEFKDRVRLLRNEKGLSATQLAADFGKSDTAVRMWETGKSKPDADTLIRLAEYFNCTTDYLLGTSETRTLDAIKNANKLLEKLGAYINQYDIEPNKTLQNLVAIYELSEKQGLILPIVSLFHPLIDHIKSDIEYMEQYCEDNKKVTVEQYFTTARRITKSQAGYEVSGKVMSYIMHEILSQHSLDNADENDKPLIEKMHELLMPGTEERKETINKWYKNRESLNL